MSQPDLFAAEAPPEPPAYRPDPEKVRSRLRRVIGQARAADVLPWEPTTVSLYRKIMPEMARYLPEEEAARFIAEFEAELARLLPEPAEPQAAAA